jgi:hypothetical protein
LIYKWGKSQFNHRSKAHLYVKGEPALPKAIWSEIQQKVKHTQTLEGLFDLWREAHIVEENYEDTTVWEEVIDKGKFYPGIEKDSFNTDGRIYEESYSGVLFILKEPNLLRYPRGSSTPSQRDQRWWYWEYFDSGDKRKDNRPKQKEKMGRMASYILHKNIHEDINGLKKSAFMNLNKRGGDNREEKVWAYTQKYVEFIKKQISLLCPKIVICLGTYNLVRACELVDESIRTMDMWHTAYQMPGVIRPQRTELGDKNIAAYMNEFIKRFEREY